MVDFIIECMSAKKVHVIPQNAGNQRVLGPWSLSPLFNQPNLTMTAKNLHSKV